jgi:purine-binding chemotaxis protein CheW
MIMSSGNINRNASGRIKEKPHMQQQAQPDFEADFYDEDEDTQKDKFLTFAVGKEDYGIDISCVTEIIGIQKITDVPDMPAYIKGVINLRGKVIPVMDVRTRFGMPERDYDERTCIVVVNVSGASVGLVVDTVREVADIPESQIELPPEMIDANPQRYIKGLGKMGEEVMILLDAQKLLRREDMGCRAERLNGML